MGDTNVIFLGNMQASHNVSQWPGPVPLERGSKPRVFGKVRAQQGCMARLIQQTMSRATLPLTRCLTRASHGPLPRVAATSLKISWALPVIE